MRWITALPLTPVLLIVIGLTDSSEPTQAQAAEVRYNFLTPSHKALPEVDDGLAILTINICNAGPNVFLHQVNIEHTITKRRYVLRSNLALDKSLHVNEIIFPTGSGYRHQHRRVQHIEHSGVLQHTFFLDVPIGRYQVTDLRLERDGSKPKFSSVNDISGLFFWYDDHVSLSYLGELNVSFGDGFSNGPTVFVTRFPNHYIGDIRARYAAVADQEVDDGNIWLQGPGGGMLVGTEGSLYAMFRETGCTD